jgi:uncharacterized iron-regulated protein
MHTLIACLLENRRLIRFSVARRKFGVSLGLGLGMGWLSGCALDIRKPQPSSSSLAHHLLHAGAIDVLLLGEQHNAPEHQQQHQQVIEAWSQAQRLGAVVLEMADAGHDTTSLAPDASPADVQSRLAWKDNAWPWSVYQPAIMSAVAHGVPVIGGNLPRERHREVMRDAAWDSRVSPQARQALEEAVREGHCDLLPASQLRPMTRIQIARDASIAQTVLTALPPKQTVIVLCGAQHAHRRLGIPVHLPNHTRLHSVRLSTNNTSPSNPAEYDTVWTTAPLPQKDHCADLRSLQKNQTP